MHTFTVTYTVKYEIDFAPNYVFNEKNECWNLKTGRKIKKVTKNGMIGYSIKGKFFSLKKLRGHLVKTTKESLPF
jgi:hypothetical protein